MVVYSPNPGGFTSRGDHSSSNPNFYTGHQGIDSENCPDLAGGPLGVVDSEMAHLVPEEVQKVDVSGSTEDRGNCVPESDGFDGDGFDGSVVVLSKFSEPYFLRRVLREESRGNASDYRLLAVAVHAVMQESGFVADVTGMPADRFHRGLWRRLSMSYSLPELVARSDGPNMREGVHLIFFRGPGGFRVYGNLHSRAGLRARLGAGLLVPRLHLDVRRFAPAFRLMRATGDGNDPEANERSTSFSSHHVKEVLEFWKMVKDGLALPLLIRLTERVGLPLPPCFMRLPKELKLKIFESLNGSDLLRVGRVCSELRRLTSNDNLWERKYEEEFGKRTESRGMINWKQRFACELERERRSRSPPPWEDVLKIIRNRYGPPLNM